MHRAVTWVALAFASGAGSAAAATLHVPSEYGTIQAAMDVAAVEDTVLVAPGTYTDCDGGPCLPATLTLKEGVAVISEGGPAVTTIRADNSWGTGSVVDAIALGPLGAEISGFRITSSYPGRGGLNALDSRKLIVRDCWFEDLAWGMGHDASPGTSNSLEMTNCVFRRCVGQSGGLGVAAVDVALENCLFEECVGPPLSIGGTDTQIGTVRDCVFLNNRAASAFIAVQCKALTVERCWFEGNDARPNSIGGLSTNVSAGRSLNVRDCVFVRNTSLDIGGAALLGGPGITRFTGNTVVQSEGSFAAGAAVYFSGTLTFRNNIIASTIGPSAVRFPPGGAVESGCNVFWNNAGGDYVNYTPDSTDAFVNPLFCDEEGGDLQLQAGSPCLSENSNGCGQIGGLGQGCGSVSVETMSWGKLKGRYRKGER